LGWLRTWSWSSPIPASIPATIALANSTSTPSTVPRQGLLRYAGGRPVGPWPSTPRRSSQCRGADAPGCPPGSRHGWPNKGDRSSAGSNAVHSGFEDAPRDRHRAPGPQARGTTLAAQTPALQVRLDGGLVSPCYEHSGAPASSGRAPSQSVERFGEGALTRSGGAHDAVDATSTANPTAPNPSSSIAAPPICSLNRAHLRGRQMPSWCPISAALNTESADTPRRSAYDPSQPASAPDTAHPRQPRFGRSPRLDYRTQVLCHPARRSRRIIRNPEEVAEIGYKHPPGLRPTSDNSGQSRSSTQQQSSLAPHRSTRPSRRCRSVLLAGAGDPSFCADVLCCLADDDRRGQGRCDVPRRASDRTFIFQWSRQVQAADQLAPREVEGRRASVVHGH
jgi:hypothetical protein